jgi:hypothetical protein
MSWIVGLALLAALPCPAIAQAGRAVPPPAPFALMWPASSAPGRETLPAMPGVHSAHAPRRSAARIVATHAAVGTGAGLLIGFLLSGASVSDDRTAVVVTWTALGAASGIVSGVVTWLVGGP